MTSTNTRLSAESTRAPSAATALAPEHEKEFETSRGPTPQPDLDSGDEKKRDDDRASTEAEEAVETTIPADESEYPDGARLAFVVVALVLSIFLFSLDLVCPPLVWIS